MDATPPAIIHKATLYTMPAKLYNDGKPLYCGPNGEKVGIDGSGFCCDPPYERYRGLPRDAVELQGSAREEFLNNLKGFWKLQPLSEYSQNTIIYTDIYVEGDKVILTGGIHNDAVYVGEHNHTLGGYAKTAFANQAQEQKMILFHSAVRGTTYIDNVGSMITRVAPDGSEIDINNALGMRVKWLRPWKLNGQANPNPNPNAGNATTGTAWNATTGTADDELTKLEKLHKNGILSDEEYTKLKMRVVGKNLSA